MTVGKGRSVKTFELLTAEAEGAAKKAWVVLTGFMTAQSVLVLAWAQVLTIEAEKLGGKAVVLVALSGLGALISVMWAALCTRMWHYHLSTIRIRDQLARAAIRHKDKDTADLMFVVSAARKVASYWKGCFFGYPVRLSGNHWVLFLTPLVFSVLDMGMLYFSGCECVRGAPSLQTLWDCVCEFWVLSAVYGVLVILVSIRCLPVLWTDLTKKEAVLWRFLR